MLYVSNIIDNNTIEVSDSRTLKTRVVNVNELRTEGTKVFGLTQSKVIAYRDVEDFLARYALRQRLVNRDYEYIFEYADNTVRVSGFNIYTTDIVDLEIPDFVDIIGDRVFEEKLAIRSVYIPDSVVKLGESCFEDCTDLESVILPKTLTTLGGFCFAGCASLKSVALPESMVELGEFCFTECTTLESITLPEGITELGVTCFYKCTALESVVLPEGVANNSISDIETFIRYFKKRVPSVKTVGVDRNIGVSLSALSEELGIEIRLLEG